MKVRRITSQDVALRAGVSRTTVSLVLNNVSDNRIRPQTAERVLNAAQELGYVPNAAARALVSRRTGTIGWLLSGTHVPSAWGGLLSHTLQGLLEITRRDGLHLMVDLVEDIHDRSSYRGLVEARQLDGLILSAPAYDEEALASILDGNLPVVLLDRLPGSRFPWVGVDDARAAQALVSHLAGLGCTRIACIAQTPRIFAHSAERLEGYRQGLEAAHLSNFENLVCTGDLTPETGYQCMHRLLDLPEPPEAVFATSDVLALGALWALHERGRSVPADVAMAGFDDIPLAAYAVPPLTSVRVPAVELARRAVLLLEQLMRGEEPPERQVLLPAETILRQSSTGWRKETLRR